jgi:hypothetical protein
LLTVPGYIGAIGASGWTAGWVAVLTTIIVTLTAYIAAERYQYLIVSYQATARQLEVLKNPALPWGNPRQMWQNDTSFFGTVKQRSRLKIRVGWRVGARRRHKHGQRILYTSGSVSRLDFPG